MWYRNRGFPQYQSVEGRRKKAAAARKKLKTRLPAIQPVILGGRRTIAKTVWGKAWCDHLEAMEGLDNRLGRGRSYVRHDCVVDLQIMPGEISALVQGSDLYRVDLMVKPLAKSQWDAIVLRCAGEVGSLLDLLSGQLSPTVLEALTDPRSGLLPRSADLEPECTCPDWSRLCKHVAAVYFAVGVRLDERPGLLFQLRQVDEQQLLVAATATLGGDGGDFQDADLEAIFGIDLGGADVDFDAGADGLFPDEASAPVDEAHLPPVSLLDATFTAVVTALWGATSFEEAEQLAHQHRALLLRCNPELVTDLRMLERLGLCLDPRLHGAALAAWVEEVLRTGPRASAIANRLARARQTPHLMLPPVSIEARPDGGVSVVGACAHSFCSMVDPDMSVVVLPSDAEAPILDLDEGTPWAWDATGLTGLVGDELRQFFEDGDALAWEDIPHTRETQGDTVLLWCDWVDWLPERHRWPGLAGVGRTQRSGVDTFWLGSLTAVEAARLLDVRDAVACAELGPRAESGDSPFDIYRLAADELLGEASVDTAARRRQWRARTGLSMRGLKSVLLG